MTYSKLPNCTICPEPTAIVDILFSDGTRTTMHKSNFDELFVKIPVSGKENK